MLFIHVDIRRFVIITAITWKIGVLLIFDAAENRPSNNGIFNTGFGYAILRADKIISLIFLSYFHESTKYLNSLE